MRSAKMAWLNSLSVKILLAYVVGALLSILLMVVTAVAVVVTQGDVLYGFDVTDTIQELARELRFDSQGMPVAIGQGGENSAGKVEDDEDGEKFAWLFESLKKEGAYRVLDASGQVVLLSAPGTEALWLEPGVASHLEGGRFEFEHAGVEMRGASQSVEHGGRLWYVQFAVSKRFMHFIYEVFALPFTAAGVSLFSLVLLFVFGPCVFFTLRFALAPVSKLSEAAAEISPRSLSARLKTDTVPREIAPLVDSFNRALERLEQGYRVQQEFLATAAHELKTPLALVRAQVELTPPSEQRSLLLHDVEHMSRQVQQLLHLAEASEAQNYRPTTLDLHDLVQESAGYLQRMADAAQVRFELPARTSPALWLADRGALFTLLKNLLENAIQHAPAGSVVSVELDALVLAVRDRGRGVPAEQLPKLFGRFWRGPHRRDDGAGLGLSICREIALAHGWTLQAANAEPGLRVTLAWRLDQG